MKKPTILAVLLLLLAGSVFAQGELPQDGLRHHFTFDNPNNLEEAAVGNDLVRGKIDDNVVELYQSVAGPGAGDLAVEVGLGSFYSLDLDFEPNGSFDNPARVNQFAIVVDFYLPAGDVWYGFHAATNDGDPTESDWESFIRPEGRLGVGSTGYSTYRVVPQEWYRLVITSDLGNSYKYYLDGELVQNGGEQEFDGRFSLPSIDGANQILLFGDNDGEDANIYIAQAAIYDRTLSDNEIYAMGGYGHQSLPLEVARGVWLFDDANDITKASEGDDLVLTGTNTSVDGPEDNIDDSAARLGVGSYYTAMHKLEANAGGERVNAYTIVADIRVNETGPLYSFLQTDNTNSTDSDLKINAQGQFGSDDLGYIDSTLTPGDWYRVAVIADSGNAYKIFFDGDSMMDAGAYDIDGRYSLNPRSLDNEVLFFADDNGEDNEIDVAFLQIYNRALNNDDILALGGYEHGPPNTEVTGGLKAVHFNGDDFNNKYARIQKTNDDFNFGDGDFTIETWVKPDLGYPSDPSLISDKDWRSGGNPGWIISIRGDDWKFNASDGTTRYDIEANEPSIHDGNWHHIAVIAKQDSGLKLVTDDFVTVWATDGDDFFNTGNIDNPEMPICIAQDGTEKYGDGPPAPAQVDEVRIWKGAAVPEHVIWEWRNREITPEHPYYDNLVGYWRFNEGEGTVVADQSGKGHDAELIGNPKWVISYAPLGNATIEADYNHNVSAVWGPSPTGASGGMTITGAFPLPTLLAVSSAAGVQQVMSDKDDNPYAVFGHNGLAEQTSSNVPAGVQARLTRGWYVDFTEVAFSEASIKFDISDMGGTGNAGAAENYVLLWRNDSGTFVEVNTIVAFDVEGDAVTFHGAFTQDGVYTLGSKNITDSPLGGFPVGVETITEGLPTAFTLENNFPNPFNPTTNIRFSLPVRADVRISVFNILGEKVSDLLNQTVEAGYHQVNFDAASRLASGMYIYTINAIGVDGSKFVESKKMMLLK